MEEDESARHKSGRLVAIIIIDYYFKGACFCTHVRPVRRTSAWLWLGGQTRVGSL